MHYGIDRLREHARERAEAVPGSLYWDPLFDRLFPGVDRVSPFVVDYQK